MCHSTISIGVRHSEDGRNIKNGMGTLILIFCASEPASNLCRFDFKCGIEKTTRDPPLSQVFYVVIYKYFNKMNMST